ncbi:MAG: hypothetical protein LBF22_11940 [Deltaproteobacteria bacterium]|nr:hypothetical protein [Deltaproteobacteria bacterium]
MTFKLGLGVQITSSLPSGKRREVIPVEQAIALTKKMVTELDNLIIKGYRVF